VIDSFGEHDNLATGLVGFHDAVCLDDVVDVC
jgi:hypothetical protein